MGFASWRGRSQAGVGLHGGRGSRGGVELILKFAIAVLTSGLVSALAVTVPIKCFPTV